MIEQALAAALDVLAYRVPCRFRFALALRLDDAQMWQWDTVLRHSRTVEVGEDRPAAHPETLDHLVDDGQLAEPAEFQMKLGVEVDGRVELLTLVAVGDAVVD